jgi:hypothetical protein
MGEVGGSVNSVRRIVGEVEDGVQDGLVNSRGITLADVVHSMGFVISVKGA